MSLVLTSSEVNVIPTPWDAKSLGVDTFEISLPSINCSNIDGVKKSLIEITNIDNPAIFYTRISANSILQKKILMSTGFLNCETQLHVVKNNLKNFASPKELGSRRLPIQHATEQDYAEVVQKSSEVFNYSRFHEDPYIDTDRANFRMKIWTEDLKIQKVPLIVSRNKVGELDSFIFYKKNDANIELILGGSMPGKGMMTPLFWASFIEYFKGIGIKSIETKISASNMVIANVYLFFNFQIKAVNFDFHKHV